MMRLVVLLLAMVSASPVGATSYYVSPSGSNANAGTSTGAPWKDIAYATCGGQTSANADRVCPVATVNASKLVAGDTLYVMAGTYTEHHIIFSNSGTSGNPITVTPYPGDSPVITGGYTTAGACGHACHVFFIDNVSYITLSNLEIKNGVLANVRIGYSASTTNITIDGCNIHDVVTADNVGNIYMDSSSDYITITNNLIHGITVDPASSPAQGQGIKIFRGNHYTINNNEIYSVVDGLMYKHTDARPRVATVSNNYIHDHTGRGIWWSSHDATISNNLVVGGTRCIGLFEDGGTLYAYYNTISHNTCVSAIGINLEYQSSGAIGNTVTNNVIANVTNGEYAGLSVWRYSAAVDNSLTTATYNLIDNTTQASPIRVLGTSYTVTQINSGTPSSLTASNNIAGNATFTNAAGGDYSLTAASAGHAAASDGTDMGVCFAKVGRNNGSQSGCTATGTKSHRGGSRLRVHNGGTDESFRGQFIESDYRHRVGGVGH